MRKEREKVAGVKLIEKINRRKASDPFERKTHFFLGKQASN